MNVVLVVPLKHQSGELVQDTLGLSRMLMMFSYSPQVMQCLWIETVEEEEEERKECEGEESPQPSCHRPPSQ